MIEGLKRDIYERVLPQYTRSYPSYQRIQSKQAKMISIKHTNIYRLAEYSKHLKSLPIEDKTSRFGYAINDYSIDQLMLQMAYHPKDHELWYAREEDIIVGWGHMAKGEDDAWELAVSVNHDMQRKGIGNKLIAEMLAWAKFHHVPEVFMHCIEDNRVIQHLASKNELKTRYRGSGERTATIEIPEPTIAEANSQLWKEHAEILGEYAKLRQRLTELWTLPGLPK